MWFENSVHVKAPLYVDARPAPGIHGRGRRSCTEGRDRPRPLPEEPAEPDRPHRRQRPADRRAPRRAPVLFEEDPGAAQLRPVDTPTGTPTRSSRRSTTTSSRRARRRSSPSSRSSPVARPSAERSLRPARSPGHRTTRATWATGTRTPISGRSSPCTTSTGSPPKFDTASGVPDNSINWSATPTTVINLTPGASYTCKSMAGSTILGELSWDNATKLLTVKGTIFIDGSITSRRAAPPDTRARRRSSPRGRSG